MPGFGLPHMRSSCMMIVKVHSMVMHVILFLLSHLQTQPAVESRYRGRSVCVYQLPWQALDQTYTSCRYSV